MSKATAQIRSERPVKETESVRTDDSSTIALVASRTLGALASSAEQALGKIDSDDVKPERIHKLRSHLRRFEVVLSVVAPGFEPEHADNLNKLVRRLRKGVGNVRDADVVMELLRKWAAGGGDEMLAAAATVQRVLNVERQRTAKRAVKLADRQSGALRKALKAMLRRPAGLRARLPAWTAVNITLARETSGMLEAVATGLSTPESLHELRLHLKEARTILELLRDTLPEGAAALTDCARNFADHLGEVNDAAVLAQKLRAMRDHEKKPARLDAIALILGVVEKEHARFHERAAAYACRQGPALARAIRKLTGEHL